MEAFDAVATTLATLATLSGVAAAAKAVRAGRRREAGGMQRARQAQPVRVTRSRPRRGA